MTLRIERINLQTDFASLQTEWDSLLKRSSNNEITLTWDWLYTWWEIFKDDRRQLTILTVRDTENNLVGIAPLQIQIVQPYRFLPKVRQLVFLGYGEASDDAICSDYLNLIIRSGQELAVIEKLVEYIALELADQWDEIVLDLISEASENFRNLQLAIDLRFKGNALTIQKGPCLFIALPASWDTFLMERPSHFRQKYKYQLNRLSRKGTIRYHAVCTLDELSDRFHDLIDLHQKRWSEKGKAGVFQSEKFLMFHKRFSALALPKGHLQLRFLMLDTTPIAVNYNFVYNNKIYAYQSGMDIHIDKDVSPGILLEGYCVQEAISNGMQEYDFLFGERPYKKRWTSTSRDLKAIIISSRGMKMRMIRGVDFLIARLKTVYRALPS